MELGYNPRSSMRFSDFWVHKNCKIIINFAPFKIQIYNPFEDPELLACFAYQLMLDIRKKLHIDKFSKCIVVPGRLVNFI